MAKQNLLKKDLIGEIQGMERNISTVSVLFHQSVSELAGLTGADHKYLEVIYSHGPLTAGKLAELTGLTTGAITGVIDRLEREGLVAREKDPNDRRKVVVVIRQDKAMQKIGSIFGEVKQKLDLAYAQFTLDELKTIKKYLEISFTFFEQQLQDLKDRIERMHQ